MFLKDALLVAIAMIIWLTTTDIPVTPFNVVWITMVFILIRLSRPFIEVVIANIKHKEYTP